MSPKRVYTDKEISAVLKRAAELQRTQGPGATSGLSLDELEQIAADVGIDPEFVKTAALELEEGRTDETSYHVLGGPTSIDLERVVEGEMTDEKWEEAVGEIRRVFEAAGDVGQLGSTREWILRDQTGERVHVTVAPQGKNTRIRLFYRMTDWAVAMHAPITAVSIAPIILQFVLLNLHPLLETGIALFIVFAMHMLARLAFGALSRSQERKSRKVLARLEDLIAVPEETAVVPADRIAAPQPDRIDASLLTGDAAPDHDPADQTREGAQRRRTR